jgi:type VI secretion system secreted protein Hcp
MALNAYLKIDGILGESQDDRHKGEIDVLSFSWGESQAGQAAHGGGGGAGKVSMQDFHFTMRSSKASPKLFHACASGQHIPRAVLTLSRAGDVDGDNPSADGFLKFTLTDVLVSSYAAQAGPSPHMRTEGQAFRAETQVSQSALIDGDPADALSLNFAKIEFWYQGQGADGRSVPAVQLGWDLKRNAAY